VHGHGQVLRKIASIGANRKTITITTTTRLKEQKELKKTIANNRGVKKQETKKSTWKRNGKPKQKP
jgi:hypothetical protein